MHGRVRVSALDRAHSHRRSGVIVGPFDVPALPVLLDRFARLIDAGPLARVCLEPSVDGTRWRVNAGSESRVSVGEPLPSCEPSMRLLETVRAKRTDDVSDGIRILCAGEYLAIDFCHGLGEVSLVNLVLDVLFGVTDPSDRSFVEPYRHRVSPLFRAVTRTFAGNPRRLAALLRARGERGQPTAPVESGAVAESFTPRPITRCAGLSADAVADLRRRRDAMLPGVGLVALATYALWECLADVGLEVEDAVKIPFDVRPYLPAGSSTLSSFTAGLDFDLRSAGGPGRLQAQIDRAARSGRPVANLALSALKAQAPQRPRSNVSPARPRVKLLHSNVRMNSTGWPVTDASRARLLVASDPVSPDGVTVTSGWLMGNLWLTAEFHGSVFDEGLVAEALDNVEGRMRELIG